MAEEIKRVRYFDGLFMKKDEFILDQDYHLRMRRLHNRHLHGHGIVWGLDVEQGPSSGEILVNKGMAIDKSFDTKFSEETGREIVVTGEQVINLSSYGTADVYVWVQHTEQQADVVPEKGGTEPIHFHETVTIGHATSKPPSIEQQLILAKVTVTNGIVGAIVTEEGGESLRIPIVTEPDPVVIPTPTPTPTPTGDSQISVTAWTEYDLTITATGSSNPTKANNPDIDKAYWRRVGDSMEVVYTYKHTDPTGATPGDGDYLFSLPPGFTIDSTKITLGTLRAESVCGTAAVHHIGSNSNSGFAQAYDLTHIVLLVDNDPDMHIVGASAYQLNGTDNEMYSFRATVPIAEWTVGTVGSFNNVEFAYNTDTTDGDDTTSFAYGEAGSPVPVVAGTVDKVKRVELSRVFKFVRLEFQEGGSGPWVDAGGSFPYYLEININPSYLGARLRRFSDTQFEVEFAHDGARRVATSVRSWSDENTAGTRWRVVGSDNPLFVEAEAEAGQVSVTSWAKFDMTITGGTTDPTKATSPNIDEAFWRRVGDSMEIVYTYWADSNTGAAGGSGDYRFHLPPGFSVDSTKVSPTADVAGGIVGSGSSEVAGSNRFTGVVSVYDQTQLRLFIDDNTVTAIPVGGSHNSIGNAGVRLSFRATVPIAGWTTGTVGSFNKVEYVYNTDTSNADDSTSFASGESGALVPLVSGSAREKRVEFSRPFKQYKIEIQPNGTGPWIELGSSDYSGSTHDPSGSPLRFGIALRPVTDTQLDVSFAKDGVAKTDSGRTWTEENGFGTRWRVVGSDNPLFVEEGGDSQVSVTSWRDYDLEITGTISNPVKADSPDIDKASWRRVGDSMEITYTYRAVSNTGASAGSGYYKFSLPPDVTIDLTKISGVHFTVGVCGSASTYVTPGSTGSGYAQVYDSRNLAIVVRDGSSSAFLGDAFYPLNSMPLEISFRATVPIAEWTTGTVGSFNRVEFAYNSDTADADDTSSVAYGENGGLVPPATGARRKRVTFSRAFKHYRLEVQVSGIGPWLDLATAGFDQTETSGHRGLVAEPISATDFDVVFPTAGISVAANNTTWTQQNAAGTRYRMVGTDNPLFVESEQLVSVTSWTDYQLDITSTGGGAAKTGSPTVDKASWRRVGDSMEIVYNYEQTTSGTAGSGSYLFSMPAGYTIDSSKIDVSGTGELGVVGSATVYGSTAGVVKVYDSTHFQLYCGNTIYNPQPIGASPFGQLSSAPMRYSFRATVPIAEWTTHTVGSYNRVEYAFNSDTANADDTTSFAWGEGGGLVPVVTSSHKNKRVKFSRPFKHYKVEVNESGSGAWWAAGDNMDGASTRHGIRLFPVSSTEIDVRFYHGGTSAGPTWTTANAGGDRWRVVGSDNPLFVEAQTNEIAPIGTINAWNKSMPSTPSLPAGWLECNGQVVSDVESPYNGQTMPNLNNAPADPSGGAANTYTKGVFLRGDTTSGVLQDDSMQGHWHEFQRHSGSSTSPQLGWGNAQTFFDVRDFLVTDPITDGNNGTPRTATETRPVNFSVVWIMRIK